MIIICNGMIRAGSTLQFNLVKSILLNSKVNHKILGYMTDEDILSKRETLKGYAKEDITYVIKTHDYSFLNLLDNVKVIYSYRGVLDVAGSVKRKFKRSGAELYKALEKSSINHHKILDNSKSLLIQDYESILISPMNTANEIMRFMNLELSTSDLNEIVEKNSPKRIRQIQNRGGKKRVAKTTLFKFFSKQDELKKTLKKVFGNKNFNRLKAKMMPHDNSTLLHTDHVSENMGQNGNWDTILDKNEIEYIKSNFPQW